MLNLTIAANIVTSFHLKPCCQTLHHVPPAMSTIFPFSLPWSPQFHVYPADQSTTVTMQSPISVLDRMSVRAVGNRFLQALADASSGKEAPPMPER